MKKADKELNQQRKVTIAFGYSLFLVTLVILVVFTVVPWVGLLVVSTVNHLNTLIVLISLVLGAVVPTIVSYLLGDRATHTKNKTSHHYNGVLFGIASYWLAILFMFIRIQASPNVMQDFAEPLSSIFASWPVLATIIVMLFVSISYAKNQKNKSSVLQHRPYQVVLIGSVAVLLAYFAISGDYSIDIFTFGAIMSLIVEILLVIIGYKVLAKNQPSKMARLTEAVVAMSIADIGAALASQFIGQLNPLFTLFDAVVPQLVGVGIWLLYWWLSSKKN